MKARKAPEPLLDPNNLRATDQQMRAMQFIMTATEMDDPLVSRIRARRQMVTMHRQILTQLTAAFLTRASGRSPALTGLERTQLCSEAWNLMNASTVFVQDFVASVEIPHSEAEEICAALDGHDEPEPRVQVGVAEDDDPAGPDAMPEILSARRRFNAVGELVTANPEE
jgi:hypothetical protein